MVFGGLELEKTEEEMMWIMLQKKRMRKKEEIRLNLIGRLSLMRSAIEGESGSDEQLYDAQVDVEEPVTETPASPEVVAQASIRRRKQQHQESTPRVPLFEFQKQ
ncbi:hypothetical protein Dimus_035745 [Dionaea muscipula]